MIPSTPWPFTWTDEVLEDAIAGRINVFEGRYSDRSMAYRLTSGQRQRFEEAKTLGYLVWRESEEALGNAWGMWCELRGRPIIEVRPRRLYAAVVMDSVTVPLRDKLPEAIETSIQAVLLRHAVAGAMFYTGVYAYVSKVPVAIAPAIAADLVPLANALVGGGVTASVPAPIREDTVTDATCLTRLPTHQRGLIVHEKCERLPDPVHNDDRIVEHGFAVGMAGPHLEQTWLFFLHREPALACGRSARSGEFVSSYGVYPAAFERRYDLEQSRDVVELWVLAGSIDRRPEESEALRRWQTGVRPDSAHWTPAGGEP